MIEDFDEKVKALKDVKDAILELHSKKIIHTDIYGCIIFVLENTYFDNRYLIDTIESDSEVKILEKKHKVNLY